MKIAFCIRPEYETGGDGIQVLKTREYLIKIHPELKIDILTDSRELNKNYDLVHIFNYATTEITRSFFERAINLGLKIVSSPIYWDYSYSIMPLYMFLWCNKSFISERFVKIHKLFNPLISLLPKAFIKSSYSNVSHKFKQDIRYFISNSQLILPNSLREGELCCKFANIDLNKTTILEIYNGIDDQSNIKILPEEEFFSKYQIPKNYILQVGRVEYLKNQMNLISALADHPDIPIIILGNENENRPYVRRIHNLAKKRGNVYFIRGVNHDDVYSFYYYAKVHVLLSMRESPGLVSLEALSQGCPIIISDRRFLPIETYFHENYLSVNPFDKKAIKTAILESLKKGHQKIDLSKYSWENVADMTFQAYKQILK